MSWQQLGSIANRVVERLDPKTFIVPIRGDLAARLEAYASTQKVKPETVIAEALSAYMGDAA
jgi:hypothetical protein